MNHKAIRRITVAGLVVCALPILYLLSSGPAFVLRDHEILPDAPWQAIYAGPLMYATSFSPESGAMLLNWFGWWQDIAPHRDPAR